MTDDFDLLLRDRLAGLAAAVPVEVAGSTTVVRPLMGSGTAGGRFALGGLVPLLAVVVISTVVAGIAKVGPFAPGATDDIGEVVATSTDGPFRLTIRSPKARYEAEEPIEIRASLTYTGSLPTTVSHAGSGPLAFGLVEPAHGVLLSPAWRLSCRTGPLQPGYELEEPFTKSGSVDATDPDYPVKSAFLQDPVLRLPPGPWHIYVVASFSVDGDSCGSDPHEMRAEIEITVAPAPGDPSPSASASPVPNEVVNSTASNGDFELTIQSTKARYEVGEPLDVVASLRYVGREKSVVIQHGVFGPIEFFMSPNPAGLSLVPSAPFACIELELQRFASIDEALVNLSGGAPIGLPAGTWTVGTFAGSQSGCSGEDPDLRTSIQIEVVADSTTPTASPGPSPAPTVGPDGSPGEIKPDGSVLDIVNDGAFELRLHATEATQLADEPFTVTASYVYLGPNSSRTIVGLPVALQLEQLDATAPQGVIVSVYPACNSLLLERGVVHDAIPAVFDRAFGDGVDQAWIADHIDESTLRLPTGEWRVTAQFLGPQWACDGGREPNPALQASIDIKVVL